MKYFFTLALSLASLANAKQEKFPHKHPEDYPPPPPPAFDADLFRRDVQVFSSHGEFLFWRIQEGALDYALAMQNSSWGPTQNYAQGIYKVQAWNGDPGFRLALSYFRAPRYWEIKGEYTRLTGHGSDSVNRPTDVTNYLTGTWPQIIPVLTSAHSSIHMNYNTFDLLVDRFFNPNPHLRLRLIGGGSLAWMNQSWTIQYFDASAHTTTTQNNWGFIGGGLKAGFMIDWYWGFHDLYMTFKTLAGGFLGTYYNNSIQDTNYPQPGANISIPFTNAYYNDVRPAFTFQIQIGPSWQRNFSSYRLEFFTGYEINGWLNLHEVYRSSGGGPADPKETYINYSMMGLQGLTTRATVDF